MSRDFWTENAFDSGRHTIVDCGYVRHPAARRNADRLLRYVGRRNLAIVGFGRVLVRVPPTKRSILRRFRSIKEEPGYCWTTHTYRPGAPQFALRYAAHG